MSKSVTLNDIFISRVREFMGTRTAYWLSQSSDLPPATISRILGGTMNPTIKVIEKIANGLGVHASALLSQEDEAIPSDILKMLANQPPFVYEAVRGMLKPLQKKK